MGYILCAFFSANNFQILNFTSEEKTTKWT